MSNPFHRLENLHIATTTTEIPTQGLFDLGIGRVRLLIQQCLARQDHCGRTVAALKGMFFFKSLLNMVLTIKTFNSENLASLSQWSEQNAGRNWLTVDQCCAGPTDANATGSPD